ncbi:hypothetical protein SAMD00019534_070230 [Acytostelium subglobosum LB1]|uniref:hypothetical protein n=1 Tax=Acytostelium subglobosum LB1 TaxID=1410327 RepID=UPI000644CB8F|nr:hypothetical protein SAMD00019534_070230 [Acytostelium subglobosum LB1]GAM23848.1 hypothetical protein SAMD00019534_070230 [Acytostelium subglobosum LB1]|eukprot:XP_012752884.1 hypothetical protein SAMD00019534_070230 [Acytostelium subglobosum LB1]
MKLTADLITRAPELINPCRERELNLRGNKISILENLGATKDQFDTLDFSDNEIARLENFPPLKRLKSLYFCNNHIIKITEEFGESLPSLTTLILTNNRLLNLSDLDPLAKLPSLKYLSLMENICTKKQNYRLYLIHIVPHLKIIDFKKVTQQERDESKAIYGQSKKSIKQSKTATTGKTFIPGEGINGV